MEITPLSMPSMVDGVTGTVWGTTPQVLRPYQGDMDWVQPHNEFAQYYDHYATQVEPGGVYFASGLTTMVACRAVALAAKQAKVHALFVTVQCDDEGHTASDSDVLALLIVMEGMGVTAFGIEGCSPSVTAEQLVRLTPYATIPLIAKPTVADGGGGQLTAYLVPYSASGVRYFGCADGNQGDWDMLSEQVAQLHLAPFVPQVQDSDVIPCASGTEARFITPDVDVSPLIRCTPDLLEDILQVEDSPVGALKIGILEEDDLDIFAQEQYAIQDALCLWSDVPELLEGALRLYQGRAFWDGTEELDQEFLDYLADTYGLVLL